LTIDKFFVGLRLEAPKAERRLKDLQQVLILSLGPGGSLADDIDLEFKKKAV